MGGRGASYGGRRGRAPRGYRTVGKSHGIPIIKNVESHGNVLPRQAKANSRFFGVNKKGDVKELRIYDKNGNAQKDIHWQHSFDGHTLGTVHSHKWKNGKRENEHFPLSQADKKKYKNAIEEATGRKDLIWEWK